MIINADDFGLCAGVNDAVAQAHTEGILTSATIMTNMPAAEEAVEIAAGLPGLGIGVHLNLTEGKPLSEHQCIKCLVGKDGCFRLKPYQLSFLSVARGDVREAIKNELSAQIQWCIDRGIRPTHLDSHKHFHCFPIIFSVVYHLARRLGINAIRWAYEPKQVCRMPWPLPSEGGKERAGKVRAMARINRFQNSSLFRSDGLLGVAHTGKIDVTFLRATALYSSVSTVEVMTHPGLLEGLDADKTRLVYQRKVEFEALCSEKTKQSFREAGIRLVHYGQL